jgi:hypothetical protein
VVPAGGLCDILRSGRRLLRSGSCQVINKFYPERWPLICQKVIIKVNAEKVGTER